MFIPRFLLLFTLLCHKRFISAEISSRIVYGELAKPGQFPFVVAILLQDKQSILCSGALLTRKHAISAAHCFNHRMKKVHYCLGGDIYRLAKNDQHARQIKKIIKITLNPKVTQYVSGHEATTDLVHNFAILKMMTPFTLSRKLNVIRLDRHDMPDNVPCIGLGFGKLSVNGVMGDDPTEALGIKLSNCSKLEHNDRSVCFYSRKLEKYMYRGDAGGPLINHKPPYKYYGTYIGRDLELKYYGIYSEAKTSLDWIQDQISGRRSGSERLRNLSKKHMALALSWPTIITLKRICGFR